MRPTAAALIALGLAATPAAAFDFGPLRGSHHAPIPVVSWQGGYFAGFGGYTLGAYSGADAIGRPIAQHFRNTEELNALRLGTLLEPRFGDERETGFGVLAGYNFQFGETVLGVEMDYTVASLSFAGRDAIGRRARIADDWIVTGALVGEMEGEVKNWATLRARFGYTLGAFMPFVTGGLAVGEYRTRTASTVAIAYEDGDPDPPVRTRAGSVVALGSNKTGYAFGLAGGVGVDVALTENLFIRGEWQHVFFPDLDGSRVTLNTMRGAAGVKF